VIGIIIVWLIILTVLSFKGKSERKKRGKRKNGKG